MNSPLLNAALPSIEAVRRRRMCLRPIRVGQAHGRESRRRHLALRPRCIAAVDDGAAAPLPLLEANRVTGIVALSRGRGGRKDRGPCQYHKGPCSQAITWEGAGMTMPNPHTSDPAQRDTWQLVPT